MLQICNIICACADHYHSHEIIVQIYNNISDMFKLNIININFEAGQNRFKTTVHILYSTGIGCTHILNFPLVSEMTEMQCHQKINEEKSDELIGSEGGS